MLQQLEHPNIVKLHDVFDEPEHYFLVTEMMSGGDLLSRLNRVSFFNEYEARRICKVMLDAVSYIHSKEIGHRDLKPENVLLDSERDGAVVKLGDFGFAKREEKPNSFTTMCGTPAYVAPEVLTTLPYGIKVDLWSVGIIAYTILVGYQPFRAEGDDLKNEIKAGHLQFDDKFWGSISSEAKLFIKGLLTVDPAKRFSAQEALLHPWFSLQNVGKTTTTEKDNPVFFMIGSQRSGSNWLRTMLDQREDLAGPHPPHMMRDFKPIVDKFGDMNDASNLCILVDHMCTFVERNQVPWTDKHGLLIKFPRGLIYTAASASCERLRKNRAVVVNDDPVALESGAYLLAVFDSIMNYFTKATGKKIWMCKSMSMSKFHDLLLEFYGEKRLRYIYLVRDPRDVAMSFMKT
jgi:serine/threonine protein kinase